MDTTNATGQTNTNFYTTSPATCCGYCDIQRSDPCMEMDIIEGLSVAFYIGPDSVCFVGTLLLLFFPGGLILSSAKGN